MPKIIFFNGPPFSGKDTAVGLLKGVLCRMAFADELKRMFCAAHGFAAFPVGKEKDSLMPAPYNYMTWRQGVIAFSENYMKPAYGQDIFGKLLLPHILASPAQAFGITDSGFWPEGQVLTQHFGRKSCCVVQLHRDGCDFSQDSRSYLTHEDIGADFTQIIYNNGTLEELKAELGAIADWALRPPAEQFYKVVRISNHDIEAVAHVVMHENLSKEEAEIKCEQLKYTVAGQNSAYWYVVKEQEARLWGGMEEFI